MLTSPKSPSVTLSQNPLSIRLYKVLAANFGDDETKKALDTLAELYAPTPNPAVVKSKGKEVRREKLEDAQDDDSHEEEAAASEKVVNGGSMLLYETVPGEIAANARKNLRRDVESKLAESSRRFLSAFAEVDKVCSSYDFHHVSTQPYFSNSIPCKNISVLCVHAAMRRSHSFVRPTRHAGLY